MRVASVERGFLVSNTYTVSVSARALDSSLLYLTELTAARGCQQVELSHIRFVSLPYKQARPRPALCRVMHMTGVQGVNANGDEFAERIDDVVVHMNNGQHHWFGQLASLRPQPRLMPLGARRLRASPDHGGR
jgi:hypothetical protein